tara:strand:- start:3512 stop:4807 length:1296 start_codon:yes stop_codon:yes gene_type:complete
MENEIKNKILQKKAVVSVIGLGYIGLPIALAFAKAKFKVNGIDIDQKKINHLNLKQSYISDINDADLKNTISNYHLTFSDKFDSITNSDVIIICVPTPLNKTKDPDISFIVEVVEQISKFSMNNKIICLESTVYPGATEEIILPRILKTSNLTVGKDFNIIFSPERIDPGQEHWKLENTPKVIGGITEKCANLGELLYKTICNEIVKVSSTRAAEMTKLLENTFRAANIGLINEMAVICEKLNLDIWEIIEAAKTKPYGYMPFYPGPGLGGHCIPVDPRYLEWKLETLNIESKFIKLSEEVNFSMPNHVVNKAKEIIKNKKLINSIFILGASYKPNVSDTRESPAIDIMQLLEEQDIDFKFNDPLVDIVKINGKEYKSEPLNKINPNSLVIIITDHSNYDWHELTNQSKYIFDTRNALRNIKNTNVNIFKL